MNKKPWHPLNFRNQKRLYEAEMKNAKLQRERSQAQKEFEREQEKFNNVSIGAAGSASPRWPHCPLPPLSWP